MTVWALHLCINLLFVPSTCVEVNAPNKVTCAKAAALIRESKSHYAECRPTHKSQRTT